MGAQETQYFHLLHEAATQGRLTIMVGSAVSLLGEIAPGVSDFIKLLLEGLSKRALSVDPKNDYATYQIGKLAEQIIKFASKDLSKLTSLEQLFKNIIYTKEQFYKNVTNTKFEEFLRLCIDNGVDIGSILKAIYKGSEGAYNLNHSALAFLANQYGITILTTNFDLGIENAGFSKSIVPENGKWTHRNKPKYPVLAKLHGCAEKGEFIATSERLLSMQSREEFSFIEDWCSSGIILFLGYSGTGDIDISPHFKQLSNSTSMLWANHVEENPPFEHAKWVSCNLKKNDSSNLLLQLALELGWERPNLNTSTKPNEKLKERLNGELNHIPPFIAARCLVDIIGRCKPKIFLIDYIIASKLDRTLNDKNWFIRRCLTQQTDPPPLRTGHNNETRRMLDKLKNVPESEIYRSVWYIFIDWRTGKQTKALQESAALVSKEIATDIGLHLRIYEIFLAIIAERLWGSASTKERQQIFQDYKTAIDVASKALRSEETKEKQSLESYFSSQLRVYEVAFWKAVSIYKPSNCIEAKNAIEKLIKLRNRAADLEVFGAVVSIDHALIGIDSFCSQYLTCTTVPLRLNEQQRSAPNTIFTIKKRIAYKIRFHIFGRYMFQFLEVHVLGLVEFCTRELTFIIHIVNLRWKRSISILGLKYISPIKRNP